MLQFPALMQQLASPPLLSSSVLLPTRWIPTHNEETLLAMQESEYVEKLNQVRKIDTKLVVIGKTVPGYDKEDYDHDDDDDADNIEESEGDEFERETV